MEILEFKDLKCVPDIVHPYTPSLRNNSTPIIIDNGSYQCRAGWATSSEPLLIFKNLIAKPRKERSKKDTVEASQAPQLQVGNDIINIEAVRFQLKTQFDRNVVTHFEAQEHLFDYTFAHLGIDSENSVPHPIVLTEAVLNPNSSRQLMSELLFECYSVPGVSYGIDCLYSYHFNEVKPQENALIINLGYHTCHVVPIIGKKMVFENTRRLNTGGFHIISFLHRILQLKYPAHATSITLSRAEELLHSICAIALDYRKELNRWTDPLYYEENIKRIQLPYNASLVSSALTLEQQKERKRELARRLTEINARKREERLIEDEEKLNQLLYIQEMTEAGVDKEEIDRACADYQIKNVQDLQKHINNLNQKIEKTKQKIIAANTTDEVEEPVAKQAKHTKMVFENEKEMHLFVQNAKKMRQEILNKKMTRKQRKQDMAKRRTAAGQERMRIISQLARKEKGNDDFGLRDEDWDIYKAISKDGGDSDSEAENEKLLELDDIIRTYEPSELDETLNPGETHQLHVGIERYRAPELIFKPYMLGSSEAGLSEVIGYVLSLFNNEDQLKLAENVVIMGGLANLPGLQERILSDLISIRPFQSIVNVRTVKNPSLGAWHGAKKWTKSGEFKGSFLTKKMYEEFGSEYFKTHVASNPFYHTPKGQNVDIEMV
ncbi:actin-related protein 5 [Tribolium castaneum]|uniref:Actin-related protein 5-like protein n=1 Tax=Tribolium castaneum TaxID=7070 RepID=A0A139WFP8_TRICA|nr:PREDICTED: actin-related protein 5 [Tribolium castaneum]KYB26627.1 Actin-related protein 5-like protein [Tribolium castaneum]|eukprot:XP_967597.1 PREDICTED: actin-related protein 5 [Tribolium castaneum]